MSAGDLEDFFGNLGYNFTSKPEIPDSSPKLSLEQQETKLKQYAVAYNTNTTLEIGDAVQEKEGFGFLKIESKETKRLVFFGYLSKDIPGDAAFAAYWTDYFHGLVRVDCVLGMLAEPDLNVALYGYDSDSVQKIS